MARLVALARKCLTWAGIEGDPASRAQESATTENDGDDEPAQGDVHSFIECSGGNPEMLQLDVMLANLTMSAASYRTLKYWIKDYFQWLHLVLNVPSLN